MARASKRVLMGSGLVGLIALAAGCGSGSFLPPPPPELNAASTSAAPAAAKVLELVLDVPHTADREMWVQAAQRAAGRAHMAFRFEKAGAGDLPSQQADRIRQAVGRGASAIIAEAVDQPGVVQALNEARDKGVKVVLIDRPVTLSSGVKPFPLVTYASFAPAAKGVVDGAIQRAKVSKLATDGPAVLLVNEKTDHHTDDRVSAIKDALQHAGIPLAKTITFDGTPEGASKALQAAVDADPKLVYVFAEEEQGLSGAILVDEKLGITRLIVVAGFVSYDSRINQYAIGKCAAVADRNLQGAILKAVDEAAALTQGRSVPERTEVPLAVHTQSPRREPPSLKSQPPGVGK